MTSKEGHHWSCQKSSSHLFKPHHHQESLQESFFRYIVTYWCDPNCKLHCQPLVKETMRNFHIKETKQQHRLCAMNLGQHSRHYQLQPWQMVIAPWSGLILARNPSTSFILRIWQQFYSLHYFHTVQVILPNQDTNVQYHWLMVSTT